MRLERWRLAERAWQQYIGGSLEFDGLPDLISESWRRVRESYRIDPGLKHPRRVLTPEALEERRECDDVLRLAEPLLREFAPQIPDHVLAYLDGEGWLLAMDGDPKIIERVEKIHFRPGVNWAETSAGTNGPGTALAAGKPVEVFACEHFVAAWQSWSCAAAPIRPPGEPAPVGLVDVTGPWDLQSRQALSVARVIARAIEERLRAAASVRDEAVRHAFQAARQSGDALLAVDPRGRIVARNDAATRRQIAQAGALPAPLCAALAGSMFSAAQDADGEMRVELPEGPAFIASAVRHEGATVGAILRVSAARSARARGGLSARYHFGRILGQSEAIRQAIELAKMAARNDLPVVVSGESGTGKEFFAHSIHAASERRSGPFVVVNCGSIPAHLVEAELFGYEAGAFTGARRGGNTGRFEDADGGTLFLDEVSELPCPAQTALLRLLQENEVVRLGGSVPRLVDVRVVAATNKALDEEVRAKRFRRDLYYRLNVLSISVPSLRDRGDDIHLLARFFLAEAEADVGRNSLALSPDAVDALRAHGWPGNVRELKNVILRAAATAPEPLIAKKDLLLESDEALPLCSPPGTLREAVLQSERNRLMQGLAACSWNVARTAQQLGVSRMTLYRLLHKYNISRASR